MRRLLVLATLVLMQGTACNGHNKDEAPIAPKVADATRVVTDDTRKALTGLTLTNATDCDTVPRPGTGAVTPPARCKARLTFSQSTPFLANLKVGELMVSQPGPGAPYGYLQRVTSVTPSGGQVVVETESASLDEALVEGEFQSKGTLSPRNLSALSLRPGVLARERAALGTHTAMESFGLDIDTVLLDADDNPSTTNDQIRLKGNFNLSVDNGLSYDLSWKKVLGVPVYPNGIAVRVAYGFSQSASLAVEADLAAADFQKEVELATYTFDPITVWVGPVPVVLVPRVRVTSDLHGNISAKMSLGASESINAVAGFEYNDGFHNITDFSKSFSKYADVDGVNGTAEVGLAVQGELLIYGLVGPYARVRGAATLDVKVPRDPVWTLNATLEGYVGIHADLLVDTLDYDTKLFGVDPFELGRSVNQPPTVSFKSPSEGQEYSQNVPVSAICVSMNDLETTGTLDVSLTSNVDGTLGTAAVSRGSFGSYCAPTRSFATLGPRTVTATVRDAAGLTATATRTIHIINNPPSVLISKPGNNATVYLNTPTLLKGTTLDPNEPLACDRFSWKSSVVADVLPADNCGVPSATFKTLGARTLTMQVTDTGDAVGTTSVTVNVVAKPANVPPDVLIEVPETVPGSLPSLPEPWKPMTVRGRIKDPDSTAITYSWRLSYLKNGVGPYSVEIQPGTVNPFNQEYVTEVTFSPHDLLGGHGTEFPCYDVDSTGLALTLTANDGVNSSVFYRLDLQLGCL